MRPSVEFIHFIILYEHVSGAITLTLSVVAFYFLIVKTPKLGKPFARYLMMLQFFITFTDLVFGLLQCPVTLFPAPAGICEGLICKLGFSSHIGETLMLFTIAYVAMSVVFCFHFKYETIVRLSNFRPISRFESLMVRIATFAVVTAPCTIFAACYTLQEGAEAHITQNFPSVSWIFSDGYVPIAYDFSKNLWLSAALVCSTVIAMVVTTCTVFFFIYSTFKILSTQIDQMSDRTRKMQRDMMVALVIQMFIPLILQIVPISVFIISISAEVFTAESVNIVFCIELLHASVHTIVLIATTPSYRQTMIDWARSTLGLERKERKVTIVTSRVTQNTS